ncbi:MAG: hypothetical protein QXI20_10890 [Candidatus Jordarchaeales archaeon]
MTPPIPRSFLGFTGSSSGISGIKRGSLMSGGLRLQDSSVKFSLRYASTLGGVNPPDLTQAEASGQVLHLRVIPMILALPAMH